MNKCIKGLFLFAAATFCIANTANAQIKVVGDDYSSNLTGSKSYYDQDVDFERYFPAVSNSNLRPIIPSQYFQNISCVYSAIDASEIFSKLNLTGDTIFLQKELVVKSGNNVQYPDFCINNQGEVIAGTMSAGYYTIEGYVFCTDNEDKIREAYGITFDDHQYYEEYTIKNERARQEKNDYSKTRRDDGNSNLRHSKREEQVSKYSMQQLKEDILRGEANRTFRFVRYIVFRPLDAQTRNTNEPTTFYISTEKLSSDARESIVPLRFYNKAMSFVGQEVVVLDGGYGHIDDEWRMKAKYNNLLRDPLSSTLIKIEDEVFSVKDIVMKDNKFYAVLEGSKTGSFAISLSFVFFVQESDELNRTYWNSYRLKESDWSRRDIPCLFGEPSDGCTYTIIVKKNDFATLNQRDKIAQAQREKEWKQHTLREKQEKESREAALKQQMIAKHGTKFGELIAKKQVAIDMTKAMCRDAWGRPMNTYRTTTKFGEGEVWCYNYKTRIYFYDGKVVMIDN